MAHLMSLKDQGRLPKKVMVDPEIFSRGVQLMAGTLMARLAPPLRLLRCMPAKSEKIGSTLPGIECLVIGALARSSKRQQSYRIRLMRHLSRLHV